MKIIDFHTHPFEESGYDITVYPDNNCNLAEDMARENIYKLCGSVISPHVKKINTFDDVRALNDYALNLAQDNYISGFHIHPRFLDESLEETERTRKKSLKLVDERVPYWMDWQNKTYSSPETVEILSLAQEYNMVVSLHTVPEYMGQIEKLLEALPKLVVVGAHPGESD